MSLDVISSATIVFVATLSFLSSMKPTMLCFRVLLSPSYLQQDDLWIRPNDDTWGFSLIWVAVKLTNGEDGSTGDDGNSGYAAHVWEDEEVLLSNVDKKDDSHEEKEEDEEDEKEKSSDEEDEEEE